MTYVRTGMSSKFGQIQSGTTELAALEHLKKLMLPLFLVSQLWLYLGNSLVSVYRTIGTLVMFLAHLSRRLIGELIVYEGIRRPSVRCPSFVRRLSTFSNDISSEAVRPILFILMALS